MEKINTNEAHIGGSVHEKLDEYFTRPKVTAVQQEKRKGQNSVKVDNVVYHGCLVQY